MAACLHHGVMAAPQSDLLLPLFEAWNQLVHIVSDDVDTDMNMEAFEDAMLQLGVAIKALSDAANTLPPGPPALIRERNNIADN